MTTTRPYAEAVLAAAGPGAEVWEVRSTATGGTIATFPTETNARDYAADLSLRHAKARKGLLVTCRDCGVEHLFRVHPDATGVRFACPSCGGRRVGAYAQAER